MDTGTVIGFGITFVGTVLTGIGVVLALVRYTNGLRLELKGDIKEVRNASASAHEKILSELGNAKSERTALSERLKCVEDKVDDIKRENRGG